MATQHKVDHLEVLVPATPGNTTSAATAMANLAAYQQTAHGAYATTTERAFCSDSAVFTPAGARRRTSLPCPLSHQRWLPCSGRDRSLTTARVGYNHVAINGYKITWLHGYMVA